LAQVHDPASGALPEEPPLAVSAKVKNAVRIVAVDRSAAQRGIGEGMSLADARGAVPDLLVAEADEAADRVLLEAIADWCDRYTPLVTLDPPHGLYLDVSGCAHLFAPRGGSTESGEAALLTDCLQRLGTQGFSARGAIASTVGAAWALAHHGGGGCIPAGGEAAALGSLPVAALRITQKQEDLLVRLGLKCIGQVIGKPRAPIAARFGASLVRRLDLALGLEDEVLSPRRPAPRISAERRFAEPLTDPGPLMQTTASLAHSLAPALERHGIGARLLEMSFFRIDGHVSRAVISTAAPIRSAERMATLVSERLSAMQGSWDPGFGFDMVRLAVLESERLPDTQIDLGGEGGTALDVAGLIDRLGARLGTSRITRFLPVDTHQPERAVAAKPLAGSVAAVPAWPMPDIEAETPPDRPLRLFARPEAVEVLAEVPEGLPLRFRWRRVVHEVVRAEGPERIASEWWQPGKETEGYATRDYYRVEDEEGRRYWIFREGLYGRETVHPAWYLHGLFG
jgi:protein ImuB